MGPNDEHLLFPEFPPVSREEWDALVMNDLNGADFEKKLVWKTREGFQVQPFYTSEVLSGIPWLDNKTGRSLYSGGNRPAGNDWLIRQDVPVRSAEETNRVALEALTKGAGSIGFVFDRGTPAFRDNAEAISILLRNIDPAGYPVHFIDCPFALDIPDILGKIAGEYKLDPEKMQGSAGIDPLGTFCLSGTGPEEGMEKLVRLMPGWKKQMPDFRFIRVTPAHFHNAGSTLVQEMAFGLSMGNEYLAFLSDRGIAPAESAGHIQFDFATGSDYFLEIARFRAARYLWSLILGAFDPKAAALQPMKIHCTTSRWNKTLYDPYVNMLRTTTEAMSAALGGADSITVEPFDAAYRTSNSFSARIARNTQIILKEEAYFNRVSDPAAGSYYIEQLTASMVQAAWELFLEVEKQGGFRAAFREGWIQDRVEEAADERIRNLSQRKDILVGTNQYPLVGEKAGETLEKTSAQSVSTDPESVRPLNTGRGAEVFEKIRLRTEKNEKTPRVFLFTYGNPGMRRARAGFATGFFACAGFEIIDHPGYASLEEGIAGCLRSGAEITVICSSDEEYPEIVPGLAAGLKNKTLLVVAGYPRENIEQLKEAGIKHFIHLRSDLAATLSQFQDELGM